MKLKVALIAGTIFFSIGLDVVAPSLRAQRAQERWFYHYDLSYRGGKTWKTLDQPFSTLSECLQFVGQGPWAKAEHCDKSLR